MKHLIMCWFLVSMIWMLSATGVVVNRLSSSFQTIRLQECHYNVEVNNQIAEVKVSETFKNQSTSIVHPRLYFPMPRGANATKLRWLSGTTWHEATIAGVPQSSGGGPSSFPSNFTVYIQLMPLVFDFPDSLTVNASLQYELTYVQMLNYNFGSVTLNLKNNYVDMQTTSLYQQSLHIAINSEKQILDFNILDVNAETSHTDHTATGDYSIQYSQANHNYRCVLFLSTSQHISWGASTYLETAPDEGPHGFFMYSAEEASLPAGAPFSMRLNIVIDVSGSMSYENRLANAKTAANYIINHLQTGDMFNVILFDHIVRPLWGSLHEYNTQNRNAALDYVTGYTMPSLNGTNLYGGLYTAISQFSPVTVGVKNCVVLLSDGQPNVGTTDTYQIINNINHQSTVNASDPYLFSFGIGSEVNYQLLNSLSQYHHGLSIFMESAEIVNTITNFYDQMRNPLFVDAVLSQTPSNAITEVFPDPFPSIYGGMQYRIVGRYVEPQQVQLGLSGMHNGINYNYDYNYQLSGAADPTLSFIPKIWASSKVDKLLIQYYSYYADSAEAIALRQQIIDISISFGVVCVFTSFTPEPPTAVDDETAVNVPPVIKLLQNYPNPFNPKTTLRFEVLDNTHDTAEIRIYNLKGQLVYCTTVEVKGKGIYEVDWNGTDMQNNPVSSGTYIYSIRCGKYLLHDKMTLQK